MRCHDILGIRENAAPEQIEAAYSDKLAKLDAGADALYPGACERKRAELAKARKDCLAWCEKKGIIRIKERITEEMIPRPNEVRTNMFCCGPVSCVDSLFGWLLCCHDGTPVAMTESIFGHQGFTIGIDCITYALIGFFMLKGHEENRREEERREKERRKKEAEEEIYRLNRSLRQCWQDQRNCHGVIDRNQQQLEIVQAYVKFLNAMNADCTYKVVWNQEAVLEKSRQNLEQLQMQEYDLQKMIKEQEEIIRSCCED